MATSLKGPPDHLAALNRTNINVQELIVEAPPTAAVCTLPQIQPMVADRLAAQRQWLPYFETSTD